ncbi:ABC transporter permease [Paraferrimonas sedimenticola]|uniref:ABC transporter n=1 Tax=Paraferrimonas sedimenticola TaxID=375674 RepID=A0AA37W1M2_9GAMM|nr:ABC transporter permease [Paraferrimonas sedimenticola]GLP96973.1 ABC transporter [Paraferrimonas sedimenticola]
MWALIRRELKAIGQDPWQLSLLSIIPMLSVGLIWWLFSAGVPSNLPVAVVDQDQSQISQRLTQLLNANPAIQPISFTELSSAETAMREGQVYALVRYPHRMRKELLTGHSPTIDIRYNAQYLLVGKLLSSQIQSSLAQGLKPVSTLRQLAQGVPKAQAAVNITPLRQQMTPFYNRNNDYDHFLLPAITVAVGQILAMLLFANGLNRELELDQRQGWLSQGVANGMLMKTAVYLPLGWLQFGLSIILAYGLLGRDLGAQALKLLPLQLMMLAGIWLIVLTIFWLMQEKARVLSFCAALFAPAFPYLGITFPTSDMPAAAKIWRLIMPSSHYIDSHQGILSYGWSFATAWVEIESMGYFLVLLIPIALLARKHAGVSEASA